MKLTLLLKKQSTEKNKTQTKKKHQKIWRAKLTAPQRGQAVKTEEARDGKKMFLNLEWASH